MYTCMHICKRNVHCCTNRDVVHYSCGDLKQYNMVIVEIWTSMFVCVCVCVCECVCVCVCVCTCVYVAYIHTHVQYVHVCVCTITNTHDAHSLEPTGK